MVQCKILIQLFHFKNSVSRNSCQVWLVKSTEFADHPLYRIFFNVCAKRKEGPESISGRCSFSILLYSLWLTKGTLAKNCIINTPKEVNMK